MRWQQVGESWFIENQGRIKRIVAKGVDLLLCVILALLFPHPLGVLLGLIYSLTHDGLGDGHSLGKRLLGLKTFYLEDEKEGENHEPHSLGIRKPCNLKRSVFRNAPFGVAFLFAIIPFWGWFLAVILGVPLVCIELTLLIRQEKGLRLGDLMADTFVLEDQIPGWLEEPLTQEKWNRFLSSLGRFLHGFHAKVQSFLGKLKK